MIDFNKFVEVGDKEILVQAFRFGPGFTTMDKEMLYDVFANKYNGQDVKVVAWDGENLKERGVYNFFETICFKNLVPRYKITFHTHDREFPENFKHEKINLDIFWNFWKECSLDDFTTVLDTAAFVGVSVGRFTPTRLRLLYEIDQAFGTDAYQVFKPKLDEIKNYYSQTGQTFAREIEWLENYEFKTDGNWHDWIKVGRGWQESCKTYNNLWPHYNIEIVPESDALSNYWFTEKTGRCLATGKPFLLLAGPHSLNKLRDFGFVTYSEIINEQYDEEFVPARRIKLMIQSLQELYTSPDRNDKIKRLNELAQLNKEIYRTMHDNPKV